MNATMGKDSVPKDAFMGQKFGQSNRESKGVIGLLEMSTC
jgi:hypothetical protein